MRPFALSLVLFMFAAVAGFAEHVLVTDGRPTSVIVTAEKPSASAKRAAEELQHFIELMSGVKLPILTESANLPAGQVHLLVGQSKLTTGIPITNEDDRDHTKEGFIVRTRGNRLLLVGNEASLYRGTEYAVYTLLESLGCRWYYPGDFGQVIPKMKTIQISEQDVEERPSFIVRNIWMSGWADRNGDYDTWLLRNKGTTRNAYAFPGDGSIFRLAPPAQYAKQYPDMYAMGRDGKRQDDKTPPHLVMLCTTNPKAVEIAAASIADHFRAHPEENSFGFSAPDNASLCYCPDCMARMHDFYLDSGIGESISDPYFNFINNLSWEVNKQFPDKYLVILAYATRVTPPEGLDRPWNPRIIVQLAQLRVSALRPIGTPTDYSTLRQDRTLKAWARITPTMLIYDYDPHADLSRMPFWRSRAIASDMRLYKRHNVVGFTTEGQNTFFRTGLNYYVRARCMWDVNTDVDKLLADYYQRFFGPAAAPMQEFGEAIEAMMQQSPDQATWQPLYTDWRPTFPPAKVAALGACLDRAEALANTPEIKQRVQLYRLLHRYMTAYLRAFTLESTGQYAEALAEMEKMQQCVQAAEALQPGLLPPDPGWVLNGNQGFNSMKTYLTALADRAGGQLGELLGRAPMTGLFRTDPTNIGLYEQWQHEELAAKTKWHQIDLSRDWGLNGYRDEEGYAYDGIGWYWLKMRVNKPAGGRAQLVVPRVYAEKIWVWVNGQLVCSPTNVGADPKIGPVPGKAMLVNARGSMWLAVDVHDWIRPGQVNNFVFRLQGSLDRCQHRGIASPPIVWAPRQ